jgi:predicted HTH transcriptional regulator
MPKDTSITVDDVWRLLDETDAQKAKLPGEITIREYASKRGIHEKTAGRRLDMLVAEGKLVKRNGWSGHGKIYFYGPVKK